MKCVKLFTPASVANVSCGFDVLGFCLDPIGDDMTIRKSVEKGVRIIKITGQNLPLDIYQNVAGVAAMALLEAHPSKHGFEIEINKRIEAGSGIGSSAASAAGAVFGLNHLLGSPYTKHELIGFAMQGEKLASGSAHADNVSPVLLGGFTLVRSIAPMDVIKLPTPRELVAVIIHPKIELKTSHARAILKKTVPLKNAIQQWGNLGALVSALYSDDYDLISRSLVDEIIEPYRAMLIPEFTKLKGASLNSGALGCGISGSGPSVYALTKGFEIAKKVAQAMREVIQKLGIGFEVHVSKVNEEGIKILSEE